VVRSAAERDPQLFEDAIVSRVLIVTPTTLIALAKAIAFGWRQEKVADNARRIADLGRDLYKRLSIMGGYLIDLGRGLDRTVKTYNNFVGSMEGSLMPQARKFNLGRPLVGGTARAKFAVDSLLEGDGFEPSVPPKR